jgi:uncharacterized surface protein with fasciclin (FAS1) repeats
MKNPSKTLLILMISTLAVSTVSACSSELSPEDAALLEERLARDAAKNKEPDTLMGIAGANADLSTLTLAVGATGVGEELNGQGPFTGFAPTNAAFDKLGQDRLAELLKPEQKNELGQILKLHIIPGSLMTADIEKAIDDGGGTAVFVTEQGGQIKAIRDDDGIVLEDGKGNKSRVSNEAKAKNGVLYTVDTVLMPD